MGLCYGGAILLNVISIVIDSSAIRVRNDCLARRTSTDATTPAAGLIISDQRLDDIEFAALLDKDASAAPIAATALTRHGFVVGDVNLVGRARLSLNIAGSTVEIRRPPPSAFSDSLPAIVPPVMENLMIG